MLSILGPDDPQAQTRNTVFAQTLRQLGWAAGRDLRIETRQVGGDLDRLRRYAAELIDALAPDVIVSVGCAGHPHDPDRVRERSRSSWRWLRLKYGTPWQYFQISNTI
jgi:hypothetical protein